HRRISVICKFIAIPRSTWYHQRKRGIISDIAAAARTDMSPREAVVASCFAIADASLRDERGHHYSLTQRISRAAAESGFEPAWMCHAEAKFAGRLGLRVAPAFSISLYDAYTKPVGAVHEPAWRRFIKKQGWFSRPEAEVVKPPPHRVQA